MIPNTCSRLAWIILLAVLGFCGCGQRAQLRGKVADGFGQPLKAVQVSIATTDLRTATGSDGEFKLRYIPGKFVVNFTKDGYTSSSLSSCNRNRCAATTGGFVQAALRPGDLVFR